MGCNAGWHRTPSPAARAGWPRTNFIRLWHRRAWATFTVTVTPPSRRLRGSSRTGRPRPVPRGRGTDYAWSRIGCVGNRHPDRAAWSDTGVLRRPLAVRDQQRIGQAIECSLAQTNGEEPGRWQLDSVGRRIVSPMVRPPASSLEIGLQQPAIACQGSFGYVWRAGRDGTSRGPGSDRRPGAAQGRVPGQARSGIEWLRPDRWRHMTATIHKGPHRDRADCNQ